METSHVEIGVDEKDVPDGLSPGTPVAVKLGKHPEDKTQHQPAAEDEATKTKKPRMLSESDSGSDVENEDELFGSSDSEDETWFLNEKRQQQQDNDVDDVTGDIENITFSVDEAIAEAKELILRGYQIELATEAHKGKNCLIIAPTGTGKTIVAISIVEQHLKSASNPGSGKVVFLVPTRILVDQQLRQFRQYMDPSRCMALSADDPHQLCLSILLENYDVLVMTPQVLLNSLESGDIGSLSVFSLVVFDECHRAVGEYPYSRIMSRYYVDKQLQGSAQKLPQVVGLTASPGSGQAKAADAAKEHIYQLCANLAITVICTVRNRTNKEEQERCAMRATENAVEISGRPKDKDPFRSKVETVMKAVETRFNDNRGTLAMGDIPADRASEKYAQFASRLRKELDASRQNKKTHRLLYSCINHLKIYNHALMIHADCRSTEALKYVTDDFSRRLDNRNKFDETDLWLDKQFSAISKELQGICDDRRYVNPKLVELEKKILEFHGPMSADSRGIIFCKTTAMTDALVEWMKATTLNQFNPAKLTGTGRKLYVDPMTQARQEEVLENFRSGDHKLIVATSVAEEGLDVAQCNYVIRYEYATSDIARVQARGRARAQSAQYFILAERGRGIIERDMRNKEREKMTNDAIAAIQNLGHDVIEKKVLELQRRSKASRDQAAERERLAGEMRRITSTGEEYILKCTKCQEFCTRSSDLRTIQGMHHVTVDDTFESRITLKPCKEVTINDWVKRGVILCKKCNTEWGIRAVYRGVPVNMLQAVTMLVIGPGENGRRMTYRKWRNVPFDGNLQLITDGELDRLLENVASAAAVDVLHE